jgi:SAM-dependent methyltransferase
MHDKVKSFCSAIKEIFPYHFKNKIVLDCGSLDINGNNRYLFEDCSYLGIDLVWGDNVDIVTSVFNYRPGFLFDTIISTGMLEHDIYHVSSLARMYDILKPGGLLLITAAGYGFKEHGTVSKSPQDSPLTNNYYKNIEGVDIVMGLPIHGFSMWELSYVENDIRFWGIKKVNESHIMPKAIS